MLSTVTGNFRGDKEGVSVEPIGDSWFLRVQSGQSELGASAVCARYSNFTGPNRPYMASSGWVYSGVPAGCPSWPWACAPDVAFYSLALGDSKQICWLSKVGGTLNGDGEYGEVAWNGASYSLTAQNMAPGSSGTWASAQCLNAGGANGVWKAPVRLEDDYEWSQGQAPQEMIPADKGICFLTRVSGNFRGYGESVSVSVVGRTNYGPGRWQLSGSSYQSGVSARAHCVYYQQF